MTYNLSRHGVFFRILSIILIAAFLAQDLVWAYPDAASTHSENTKLAPQLFTGNPGSPSRAAAKFIESAIESNGSIAKSSITVKSIEAIVRNNGSWFAGNNITVMSSPDQNEIIILFPKENIALRYYDPSLARAKEGYREKYYERLGSVDKQVLEKSAADAGTLKPEGAAVEGHKMETAAIIGLVATPFVLAIPFFHLSVSSIIFALSYIGSMMALPIFTARHIEDALRYRKQKTYGLIEPFRRAKDIKSLYAHDPDALNKVSYYSYSLEEKAPGKSARMSQLYVDKEAMEHIEPMIQRIIYLHEWLHGYARVRTELINVPLTYSLPWMVLFMPMGVFTLMAGQWHDTVVLFGLSAYNAVTLIAVSIIAAFLPSRVTGSGHTLMATEYWHSYTEKEIDDIITDYAHTSTIDERTGYMMPVKEWLKSGIGGKVVLVPSDLSRSEDIIVIKSAYMLEAAEKSRKKQALDNIDLIGSAVSASAKRSFRVIIAVTSPEGSSLSEAKWRKTVNTTIREARYSIRSVKPGSKVRFEIRSTDCDITRLRDLQKFYRRRQERIAKSLLVSEAVGCEVHGNVPRLAKLLEWLRRNGYENLTLLGDYLGKDLNHGFDALDFLRDYVIQQKVPKLKMLIGKSEYAFLLALLGDGKFTKIWYKMSLMEGPAVLEGLRRLSRKTITKDMSEYEKQEIEDAVIFEKMVDELNSAGRGGWEKWYRFHPKLLQLADFIINNMYVAVEDDHHIIYTIGSRVDIEEFEWRGLKGIEALFYMQREFKEHATVRLRVLRIIYDISALTASGRRSDPFDDRRAYVSEKVSKLISDEKNRNRMRGREVIPDNILDSIDITTQAAIDGDDFANIIDVLFTTLDAVEGPLSDIYRDAFFDKLVDMDSINPIPKTRSERNATRQKQMRLVGANTTINLSVFTRGVRNEFGWPKGTQAMEQVRLFDSNGRLAFRSVDSLDRPDPDEYIFMTNLSKNEGPEKTGDGMSLESTTKDKLLIVNRILADYKPLIALTRGRLIDRLFESAYYYISEMALGLRERVARQVSANMLLNAWPRSVPRLLSKGFDPRLVSFLGGFEELFYSGLISALPAAVLMWAGIPSFMSAVLALPLGSFIGYRLFTGHHDKVVYHFSAGTIVPAEPSAADRSSIASLGLGLRAVFAFSLLGTGSPAGALVIAILAHGLYNAFIAPRLGTPLALAQKRMKVSAIFREVDRLTDMIDDPTQQSSDNNETIGDIIRGFSRLVDRMHETASVRAFRMIALPLRKRIEIVSSIVETYQADYDIKNDLLERLEELCMEVSVKNDEFKLDIDREYEDYLKSDSNIVDYAAFDKQDEPKPDKNKNAVKIVQGDDIEQDLNRLEAWAQKIARETDPVKFKVSYMEFRAHWIGFISFYPRDVRSPEISARCDALAGQLTAAKQNLTVGAVVPDQVSVPVPVIETSYIPVRADVVPASKGGTAVLPEPAVIQDNIKNTAKVIAADRQFREDIKDRPITDNEKIIFSESLFIEGGDREELEQMRLALASILNKPGSRFEILDQKDIMQRVTNANAVKDKIAAVLSREDIEKNPDWSGPGKAESIKATVLVVDDKLTGLNYLYLTGLIGFARAVMAGEKEKIARYYKLLTGSDIDSKALELLTIADAQNTIPFALKTILKFRPIEAIDTAMFDSMRIMMENFLISA